MYQKLPPFNIFGSGDSQDYDVLFFVRQERIETRDTQAKHVMCEDFGARLTEAMGSDARYASAPKPINANLAYLDVNSGTVVRVFKGTADEVNNSVIETYGLHPQVYSNYVMTKVERDIELKVLRTCRVILSFLTRTHQRNLVKQALGGSLADQVAALKQIDFASINDLGTKRNVRMVDFYKVMAFQYGQTLALMAPGGIIELYTKESIAARYPELRPMLYREPDVNTCYNSLLQAYNNVMLDCVNTYFEGRDTSQLYEKLSS